MSIRAQWHSVNQQSIHQSFVPVCQLVEGIPYPTSNAGCVASLVSGRLVRKRPAPASPAAACPPEFRRSMSMAPPTPPPRPVHASPRATRRRATPRLGERSHPSRVESSREQHFFLFAGLGSRARRGVREAGRRRGRRAARGQYVVETVKLSLICRLCEGGSAASASASASQHTPTDTRHTRRSLAV